MQQSLFVQGPPAVHQVVMSASRNVLLERLTLLAMRLYVDDYSLAFTPETSFGALTIAQMIACGASGPFCIAVVPLRVPSITELYTALDSLVVGGELIRENLYHGTTGPGGGDYQGFSYTYRIAEQA
jgi:hypothetical protein